MSDKFHKNCDFYRNVEMRNALDLFVNVVHCKSVEGVETRHKNVDIVVIRWGHNTPLSILIYSFKIHRDY